MSRRGAARTFDFQRGYSRGTDSDSVTATGYSSDASTAVSLQNKQFYDAVREALGQPHRRHSQLSQETSMVVDRSAIQPTRQQQHHGHGTPLLRQVEENSNRSRSFQAPAGDESPNSAYTFKLLASEVDILKDRIAEQRRDMAAIKRRAEEAESTATLWKTRHAEACRTIKQLQDELAVAQTQHSVDSRATQRAAAFAAVPPRPQSEAYQASRSVSPESTAVGATSRIYTADPPQQASNVTHHPTNDEMDALRRTVEALEREKVHHAREAMMAHVRADTLSADLAALRIDVAALKAMITTSASQPLNTTPVRHSQQSLPDREVNLAPTPHYPTRSFDNFVSPGDHGSKPPAQMTTPRGSLISERVVPPAVTVQRNTHSHSHADEVSPPSPPRRERDRGPYLSPAVDDGPFIEVSADDESVGTAPRAAANRTPPQPPPHNVTPDEIASLRDELVLLRRAVQQNNAASTPPPPPPQSSSDVNQDLLRKLLQSVDRLASASQQQQQQGPLNTTPPREVPDGGGDRTYQIRSEHAPHSGFATTHALPEPQPTPPLLGPRRVARGVEDTAPPELGSTQRFDEASVPREAPSPSAPARPSLFSYSSSLRPTAPAVPAAEESPLPTTSSAAKARRRSTRASSSHADVPAMRASSSSLTAANLEALAQQEVSTPRLGTPQDSTGSPRFSPRAGRERSTSPPVDQKATLKPATSVRAPAAAMEAPVSAAMARRAALAREQIERNRQSSPAQPAAAVRVDTSRPENSVQPKPQVGLRLRQAARATTPVHGQDEAPPMHIR